MKDISFDSLVGTDLISFVFDWMTDSYRSFFWSERFGDVSIRGMKILSFDISRRQSSSAAKRTCRVRNIEVVGRKLTVWLDSDVRIEVEAGATMLECDGRISPLDLSAGSE